MNWKRLAVLLFVLMLFGAPSVITAQNSVGFMRYNQSVNAHLPAEGLHQWSFSATAGDLIEASVVADPFDPNLALIDPFGRVVELVTDMYPNRNAYFSMELGFSGIYQLQVGSQDGQGGYYLLTLNSIQPRTPAYLYRRYNFEGFTPAEWQPGYLGYTPSGRGFYGPIGANQALLTLQNLPIHDRVTLDFDLYVNNSWDGNNADPGYGPDLFRLVWSNTGETLVETSFSNYTWSNQSYPDDYPDGDHPPQTEATETGTLGYVPVGMGDMGDSVYHFTFHLTNTDSWLQFAFSGINLEGVPNESWGLDNVRIFLSYQSQYNPISMCTNQPATFLRPGMHVATSSYGLRLVTQPDTDESFAAMSQHNPLLILDGPSCYAGRHWWLVETEAGRAVGWIAETDAWGRRQIYRRLGTRLEPVNWQRLRSGYPQVEAIYYNGVNVRDAPSINADKIGNSDRGVALRAVGLNTSGRWVQVEFTDRQNRVRYGWMCRHLLRQNALVDSLLVTDQSPGENCRGEPYP